MKAIRHLVAVACASLAWGCGTVPQAPDVRQALAPTGKLRVALFDGNAVHVVKDPGTGELKGVAHDLGRELAGRLGVPFEPKIYTAVIGMFEGGAKGEWDVVFAGINPERSRYLDFTATHLEVEMGYLVPPGSRITSITEVDRPGVRVAVVTKASPDVVLSNALKSATLVRAPGQAPALEMVKTGKADVFAGVKAAILQISGRIPGSRVLEGRFGTEDAALGIPKGRGAEAHAYVRRYIEEAKANGTVKAAIERAGVRAATVAPLQ